MDFAKLSEWVDRLPAGIRAEIIALKKHSESGATGKDLLMPGHGGDMATRHRTGQKFFESRTDPFCLVRVGSTESSLLGAGIFPTYRWYFHRKHFDRDALRLRSDMVDAFMGAEIVGVHREWEQIAKDTEVAFRMLGIALPLSRGVEVHLPYRLLVNGALFRYLAGKRVLLVGGRAPELLNAWSHVDYAKGLSSFGPYDEVDVVGAVATTSRAEGGSHRDYPTVLQKVMSFRFDVALVACGITAKPLAWKIRQEGKSALDVGFVFDAILGHPERHKRPVFCELNWSIFPR